MKNVEKVIHKRIKKLSTTKKLKSISNEMMLKEDLGLASMDQVALFTSLTDEFKLDLLQFEDKDLVNIKSVQDIVSLFQRKLTVKQ